MCRSAARSIYNDASIPTINDNAQRLPVPNIAHLAEKSRILFNILMVNARNEA